MYCHSDFCYLCLFVEYRPKSIERNASRVHTRTSNHLRITTQLIQDSICSDGSNTARHLQYIPRKVCLYARNVYWCPETRWLHMLCVNFWIYGFRKCVYVLIMWVQLVAFDDCDSFRASLCSMPGWSYQFRRMTEGIFRLHSSVTDSFLDTLESKKNGLKIYYLLLYYSKKNTPHTLYNFPKFIKLP